MQNLGIGVSYELQTCFGTHYGPLRPFWDAHPAEKYVHPWGTPAWKKNWAKWPFLGQHGDGCAWCLQIMWGTPAPPECVKQGLEPRMMAYTPSYHLYNWSYDSKREGKFRDFGPHHFLKEKWWKIEGFKEVPPEKRQNGTYFQKIITFVSWGVIQ